jgi:hypothetical protein
MFICVYTYMYMKMHIFKQTALRAHTGRNPRTIEAI